MKQANGRSRWKGDIRTSRASNAVPVCPLHRFTPLCHLQKSVQPGLGSRRAEPVRGALLDRRLMYGQNRTTVPRWKRSASITNPGAGRDP
jgi:hypothetical protein